MEPDWKLFGGSYTRPEFPKARTQQPDKYILQYLKDLVPITFEEALEMNSKWLKPSTDEVKRNSLILSDSNKRFHYRYLAELNAAKAATLLTESPEDQALALALAGAIRKGEPRKAYKYYLSILKCCSATRVGKATRQKNNLLSYEDLKTYF